MGYESILAMAGISSITGLNYILVLLALGLFVASRAYRRFSVDFLQCIFLYILLSISVLSYLTTEADTISYITGFAVTTLPIVSFVVACNVRVSQIELITFFKPIVWLVLALVTPQVAISLYDGMSMRFVSGYFREAGALGMILNICCVICISILIHSRRRRYLWLAIVFTVIIYSTVLKKAIFENVLIWLAYIFLFRNSNKGLNVLALSILVSCLVVVFWSQMVENLNDNISYIAAIPVDEQVRPAMYIGAFKVATDYFPLGSGFGTFGSSASIFHTYSNLYYEYNISIIPSNSIEAVATGYHTLLDTYWPHILAELGFVGAAVFVCLYLYPLKMAYSLHRVDKSVTALALNYYVFMVTTIVFVDGFALYTPEIPIFILLTSVVSGLSLAANRAALALAKSRRFD